MPQDFLSLQGSAHGYALVHGGIRSQESVVEALWEPRRRATTRADTVTRVPRPQIIRLTCSITLDGRMAAPNDMMLVALGYSREELAGAPIGALLRPAEDIRATERAIFDKFKAVQHGESEQESFTSWMQAKDGSRINVASTVTWSTAYDRWDIIADTDISQATGRPQYLSPLDRIPMLEWLVNERLLDQEKEIRAVARDVLQEELLELEHSHVTPIHRTTTRRGGSPPKYPDASKVAAQVAQIMANDDYWGVTITDVLKRLKPPLGSRNTLVDYLIKAGVMKKGDSLKKTLRKLGQERLDDDDWKSQLPSA